MYGHKHGGLVLYIDRAHTYIYIDIILTLSFHFFFFTFSCSTQQISQDKASDLNDMVCCIDQQGLQGLRVYRVKSYSKS